VGEVRQAIRLSLIWTVAGGLVLGLAFLIAGPWLIDLMATDPGVRAEARAHLPWIAAAPIFGALAWAYDGIYIGALLTAEMRRLMLISAALYAAALVVLLPFGNHGLWAAMMVLFTARSALMLWRSPLVAAQACLPAAVRE
jgi:multidrug resistance protein, MATE family